MIKEEAERIVAHVGAQPVGSGRLFQRTYSHPEFNHPEITITVSRPYGSRGYLVRSSLEHSSFSSHFNYESRVGVGERLDTRLLTAFRRGAEAGTVQHWRVQARATIDEHPAVVWDGVKEYLRRRHNPRPADYVLGYPHYWDVPLCQRIIEGFESVHAYQAERRAGWSQALMQQWLASLDG